MERPAGLERELVLKGAEVERLDALDVDRPHLLAGAFHDGDLEPQPVPLLADAGGTDLGLGISLEGIERTDVLQVLLQLAVHQPAAAQVEQASRGGRHQLRELVVAERFIAGDVDIRQGVLRAGVDAEDDLEHAVGRLLLGFDLHPVVAFALVVVPDPLGRLEEQGFVVALAAEEGEEAVAAQLALLGTDHLELDEGADLDRKRQPHGAARTVDLLDGTVDLGGAVFLADQPVLEAIGVFAGGAAVERLARLQLQRLEQRRGRQGVDRAVEEHGLDARPRPALDLVGDDRGTGHGVGGDVDPDLGLEIAAVVVVLLEPVDALDDLLLVERLGLVLRDFAPQLAGVQAELPRPGGPRRRGPRGAAPGWPRPPPPSRRVASRARSRRRRRSPGRGAG